MIKFFICLVFFFIIFDLLTKNYVNPYKLIMIFGKKGSGKTTTLTALALDHVRKGWNVYSTIDIPFCNTFNVDDIGTFTFPPKSAVFIDEVGMIWDNRDFKNFKTNVRDFFKLQRQYKCKVYLFSQSFDIDKKLRDLTDEMYLLTNFCRVWSFQRRILKKIGISNGDQNNSGVSSLVDTYRFDLPFFGGWKFVFIPRYVKYFTSFDPKPLPYLPSSYVPANDEQTLLLSTWKWLLYSLKKLFLSFFYLCIYPFKTRSKKK